MKKIYIVSSTHWDREWYESFQQYRARLVRMMDEVIDILENVPDYRCFHLDGQTIVLEDYLRIRPENTDRVMKLVREKKLLIGPWFVMPDEFLISGESLVRNLERGHEICSDIGVEPCREGYICDIFGHNSQMPQIFAGFGIDNAQFFRGREGYEKDNFLWRGADGTEAIVHKLHPDYAYSSFFYVMRWPFEDRPATDGELVEAMRAYLEREEGNFATDCHLMMDGVDHIDPERELPHIIKTLNANIDGYEFIHSNFEDYTEEIRRRTDALAVVEGCLYDVAKEGINNSLLKNVLSSMVHLKQSNAYLESHITLQAEPLDVFLAFGELSAKKNGLMPYGGFFKEAWHLLLQNHPHDSICGCSRTETHEDNVNRYRQAAEILGEIRKDELRVLAASVTAEGRGKDGAFVVLNSSQTDLNGIVEVPFKIKEGTHQFRFEFFDSDGKTIPYHIISFKKELTHKAEFKKLIQFESTDVLTLCMQIDLPAYSYKTITYNILRWDSAQYRKDCRFERFDRFDRNSGSMRCGQRSVDNGKLAVTFNDNGTIDVCYKPTGKIYRGLLALEDCGDAGEGWNYVKPMFDREITPSAVSYEVLCDNPHYFRAAYRYELSLPCCGDGMSRSGERKTNVVTNEISVANKSAKITVKTTVENRTTNHRLRVIMPTNIKAETFKTKLPFDLYEWDIEKKNTDEYKETDTLVNPAQGAVSIADGVNSLSVYTRGLYEVAVLDRAENPLYLTLFRSFTTETGREEAKMGKMIGEWNFDYQLDFEPHSPSQIIKEANAFAVPPVSVGIAQACGELPASGELVRITGDAVLSALRRVGEEFEIRIYDADSGCAGEIHLPRAVTDIREVDMRGIAKCRIAPVNGDIPYTLKKREIKTYRFR